MEKPRAALIPDAFLDLLDAPVLAHLATVRPDGTLQVNPMWFGWDGEFLQFTSTTTRYKHQNILRRPQVAASICDPADPYRCVSLRGAVERIEPDIDGRHWLRLARRYESGASAPPHDADRRVAYFVRVTGASVFARRDRSGAAS